MKKSLVMVRRNFLFTMLTFCLLPKITLAKQNNDELRKHFIGSNTAPIKIKEYFSLTCGHCANFHTQTLPEFKKNISIRAKYSLSSLITLLID